jgi:acyl-CoA thioesterase FadM
MGFYLEHLFNTLGVLGTILVDVSTKYQVAVFRDDSLLIGLVITQLREDGLGYVCIEVVDENAFAHFLTIVI